MGRFRESSSPDRVQKVHDKVLSWNAAKGEWYFRTDTDSGFIRNIRGLILEPSLYRITGKNEDDDSRIYSNLCKNFLHDTLKVHRKTLKGKSVVIGEGTWSEIEKDVKFEGGRWTKVVGIMLLQGEMALFEDEKLGDYKKTKFENEICFLYMKGNAIRLGWSASFEESEIGVMSDDSDGLLFSQTESEETAGKSKRQTWLQPIFKFTQPGEGNKAHDKILEAGTEAFEKLNGYLEEYFKKENFQSRLSPDEEEEEETEDTSRSLKGKRNPLHPPVDDDDEDLPF